MVVGAFEMCAEFRTIQIVCLAKVVERVRVIAQLGVDQAYEQMGVNAEVSTPIHRGMIYSSVSKSSSGRPWIISSVEYEAPLVYAE